MKVIKIFFGILTGLFALSHCVYLPLIIIRGSALSIIFGSLFWLLIGAAISIALFISAFKKKPVNTQSLGVGPETESQMQIGIEYKNTKHDQLIWGYRTIFRRKINLLIYCGLGVVIATNYLMEHDFEIETVLGCILFIGVILIFFYSIHIALFTIVVFFTLSAKKDKGFLTGHKLVFNKNGYIEETNVNRNEAKWKGVFKIEKGRWHIYLYESPYRAHLVPKRAFKSDIEYDAFYNTLQMLRESAMASEGAGVVPA